MRLLLLPALLLTALSPRANYTYSLDIAPSTGSFHSPLFQALRPLLSTDHATYIRVCLCIRVYMTATRRNARLITSLFPYKVYYLCTISAPRDLRPLSHTLAKHTRSFIYSCSSVPCIYPVHLEIQIKYRTQRISLYVTRDVSFPSRPVRLIFGLRF